MTNEDAGKKQPMTHKLRLARGHSLSYTDRRFIMGYIASLAAPPMGDRKYRMVVWSYWHHMKYKELFVPKHIVAEKS